MYDKRQSYDVWFLRNRVQGTEFFIILDHFLLFYLSNNPKNQNFQKLKKSQKISFYAGVTINANYMMYYWARQTKFFVILDHILHFYPPNSLKNQNFEKVKKRPGDIVISHMFTINDNQMMYGSWDMEHDRQNFLLFWNVFCPFNPLTTQKIKIFKKWKKPWRYYHFIHAYKEWQSYDV